MEASVLLSLGLYLCCRLMHGDSKVCLVRRHWDKTGREWEAIKSATRNTVDSLEFLCIDCSIKLMFKSRTMKNTNFLIIISPFQIDQNGLLLNMVTGHDLGCLSIIESTILVNMSTIHQNKFKLICCTLLSFISFH